MREKGVVMKLGDEVYAVDSLYAFVRHGFITGESNKLDSTNDAVQTTYMVEYNDNPYPPYIAYPTYGKHSNIEIFSDRGQAVAYAEYLRRDV